MAEKKLKIDIITPKQILFSGEADLVNVPGMQSPFEVLYNHAPIVSALERGMIRIADQKQGEQKFVSSLGFIEVLNNKVSILVEKAENMDSLTILAIDKRIAVINNKLMQTEINEAEKISLNKDLDFEEYCKKIISKAV